ncbi:MAG: tyrosine-type recombinase/integrase [Rhodothermales bacterium]
MSTTSIQYSVERYLEERRRLGFELRIAGAQLMNFARYADANDHRGPLTIDLQLAWARERGTKPITWARRLEVVRPFAKYYCQFEPDTAVPDAKTFGPGHRRLAPHIYTHQEILDLLQEAGRLRPLGGLRPATYRTLFGLIATAGLRLSEALYLRVADVDLLRGLLTVRETKFRKSRLLPLHASTLAALRIYRDMRDQTVRSEADMPFFASSSGAELPSRTVHEVFVGLRRRLGWVARGDHPNPRIHDLRHTFAVRRIQLWHQSGVPLDQGTFWLSTYLGHAKISDTYWYLTGTPELLSIVAARFECFVRGAEEVNDA